MREVEIEEMPQGCILSHNDNYIVKKKGNQTTKTLNRSTGLLPSVVK